jgi:regulator of RNase E activity RraA
MAPAERVAAVTPSWTGLRSEDGRPHVPGKLLERLARLPLEPVWDHLRREGHANQFEDGWMVIGSDRPLVGRALPARFLPARPDLDAVTLDAGRRRGFEGAMQNSWVVDLVSPDDVVVVDLFGKRPFGAFTGDLLATTIRSRGGRGAVIDGAVRDRAGMARIDGLTTLCRDSHPSFIEGATLVEINGPIRVGAATVLPGDVVLATSDGVLFVPPHLVEAIVEEAERTAARDDFARRSLADGRYSAGALDRDVWAPEIETAFERWYGGRHAAGDGSIAPIDGAGA